MNKILPQHLRRPVYRPQQNVVTDYGHIHGRKRFIVHKDYYPTFSKYYKVIAKRNHKIIGYSKKGHPIVEQGEKINEYDIKENKMKTINLPTIHRGMGTDTNYIHPDEHHKLSPEQHIKAIKHHTAMAKKLIDNEAYEYSEPHYEQSANHAMHLFKKEKDPQKAQKYLRLGIKHAKRAGFAMEHYD